MDSEKKAPDVSKGAIRNVRAKMRCTKLKKYTDGGHSKEVAGIEVGLMPVYGEGEDKANAEWSKWTPSGELNLQITNPATFDFYEVGRAYFVDMTPAD